MATKSKRMPRRGNKRTLHSQVEGMILSRATALSKFLVVKKLPKFVEDPPVTRSLRFNFKGGSSSSVSANSIFAADATNYLGTTIPRYQFLRIIGIKCYLYSMDNSTSNTTRTPVSYAEVVGSGTTSYNYELECAPGSAMIGGLVIKPSYGALSYSFSPAATAAVLTLTPPAGFEAVADVTVVFN
jgi:hypothetical protein